MSIGGLLHSLHDTLVYPEGDRAGQRQQGDPGKHRDHRETGHGQQEHKAGGAHDTRLLHISPVDEGLHCKEKVPIRSSKSSSFSVTLSLDKNETKQLHIKPTPS